MRASISKPTPFIYLLFGKKDPFIYLIIQNVDLFILIFVPINCWLLDKYHSQFIDYQENKKLRKVSERKLCGYTRMSEKWGLSHRKPEKSGQSYIFSLKKKGANLYLAALKRRGYSARTSVLCHYRKLPPAPAPSKNHFFYRICVGQTDLRP